MLKKTTLPDIKVGEMTFGQRIALGEALSESDPFARFKKTLEALDIPNRPLMYRKLVPYFHTVVEGMVEWAEKEARLLKYEPTAEEKKAGISELTKRIGEMGTIKAMAKAYGVDPDEILKWKYSKVFGILFTDLEEYKYQDRYNKVLEAKYKR